MWEFVLPDPRCWIYLLCLPVALALYIKLVLPRFKTRHCLAYLLLCAMIASLTVTSSRSASSLLTNAFENGIKANDGR